MVFCKSCEVREMRHYGETQRGIFALEPIKAGEIIWHCECADKDVVFTRDQLLEIIEHYPRLDYFVRSFSYMVDDDLYAIPHTFMEQTNNDECALFNHSCEPNIGFAEGSLGDCFVAMRDISPGEELTYHYGFLETESSLIQGLECKCGAATCAGRMTFDYYRDPAFVRRYFNYMTAYLKKKCIDLQEKWTSDKCYVKRFPTENVASCASDSDSSSGSSCTSDIEAWDKGLVALKPIQKGERVAVFSGGIVNEKSHFLRDLTLVEGGKEANCEIVGNEVYAICDIPPETELSVYYHHIIL